jgi:membrane associated rhomboid family serine protease
MGKGQRRHSSSGSDEEKGELNNIPPPAKHEDIRIAKRSVVAAAPPAYDPDDEEDFTPRKSENDRKRGKSAMRVMRAMSQANIAEKSERPDRRIARMGTIRDNVYEEVITVYRPWFTFFIVVANVGVFLYCMWLASWNFESLTVNPLLGPSATLLVNMGAKDTAKIINGDWWRLFTPMFLHAGVIHLAMNMLMMKRLGQGLEESFGFFVTASIYLISGVSGVVLSCVMNPSIIGVGASGALYGLVGALFGDFFQNYKTIVEGRWMYFMSMVFSLAVGMAMGLLPVLDNWAHIGGLICGFMLGLILLTNTLRDERGKRLVPWYSKLITVLAAVALVVWFLVLFSLLYSNKNGNQYCPYCKYLDCVDTPWWTCPSAV